MMIYGVFGIVLTIILMVLCAYLWKQDIRKYGTDYEIVEWIVTTFICCPAAGFFVALILAFLICMLGFWLVPILLFIIFVLLFVFWDCIKEFINKESD